MKAPASAYPERQLRGAKGSADVESQAAHAASHTRDTYLAAQYRRLAARIGKKKALIAVGHTILTIIFHVLNEQKPYQELGSTYFDERERQTLEKRLVHRLEKLGYEVALQPQAQAA